MDLKVTNELMHLRAVIQEKDRRLDELYSEVDKLSSVLQQHISECDTWKKVSMGQQINCRAVGYLTKLIGN